MEHSTSGTRIYTIIGQSPSSTGSKTNFKIDRSLYDELYYNGPEHKYHEMRSSVEVLNKPYAIFLGLKRDNQEKVIVTVVAPKVDG